MSNSRSEIIVLAVVAILTLLSTSADAHCKRHDRKCCRQRVDYGRCQNHVRRWAYNVTCGQCVPFDYSGCGGDENNFELREECDNCCRGTPACPKFSLPKPPHGCEYKWHDGPDYCPRPKLQCSCPKITCRIDSCRHGERCIPEPAPCNRCPCPQYRCVTDPCYAVQRELRPCEKCVALPAPKCHHAPCPLIAYRENHCAPRPQPAVRHHCSVYVECPPAGNPCESRRCPAHPEARCVVDPCDCRKHTWQVYDRSYREEECYFGRR